MSPEQRCILCEKDANVEDASGRDAIFVRCETCGKYYLGEPSELVRYYREEVQREKRAMLSAYTRELFELGEKPPVLGYPDALEGIIAEYENKSDDEKLENVILYLRRKSPQFGDSVEFRPDRDYPIVYGLEENDFLRILNSAMERDYVVPMRGRFEEGIKLTSIGWRRGTELMEEREGDSS